MSVIGVGFIIVWLIAGAAWAAMSAMGAAMANDSGRLPAEKHAALFITMMIGAALLALAGVPGGLAFFWDAQRSALLWTFGGLLLLGATLQIYAFWAFFS